jgi:alcohol dehydrogenase
VCDRQFQPGFTHWGSFAERVAVHYAQTNLVRLPDEMDFTTAAALGCRFATAFRAVVEQGRVAPGEWVAVHGCGGVGLSAIMIAAAHGARVVAVDIDTARLESAGRAGAEVMVEGREPGRVAAAVVEATGGGAHLSLDALGHPVVCANSVLSLRKQGRHVQVGILEKGAEAIVPMDRVIGWELEILGSHGMAAGRYPVMLDMITAGRLDPGRLVGRRISLEEAPEALTEMDSFSGIGMTVIDRL